MLKFEKAIKFDHELLSQIAIESKAYWQYPQQWLDIWKNDLTISQDFIDQHNVIKATLNNQPIGFYSLLIQPNSAYLYLEHLWLLPEYIGKGFGKALLDHTKASSLAKKAKGIELVADPNAKSFYEKQGFKQYDIQYSSILNTPRQLPMMRFVFTNTTNI